jgi:hypothetical protein
MCTSIAYERYETLGASQESQSRANTISANWHIYAEVNNVGPSDQQKNKGASRGLSVGMYRVVSKDGLRCLEQ